MSEDEEIAHLERELVRVKRRLGALKRSRASKARWSDPELRARMGKPADAAALSAARSRNASARWAAAREAKAAAERPQVTRGKGAAPALPSLGALLGV